MELLYRRAEWMTAMAAMGAGSLSLAEQEKLTKGWKLILTNQFHDIIPGSSIHEVYEDSRKDYQKIQEIGMEVLEDFRKDSMENTEKAYTVYNASGWNMNETVALPASGSCSFTDEEEIFWFPRIRGCCLRTGNGCAGHGTQDDLL